MSETLQIFTVNDVKAGAYMTPFFSRNRNTAIRDLQTAVNDPEHMFHKHPEDYTLFWLGEFTLETAHMSAGVPEQIARCMDLMSGIGGGE